MRKLFSMQFIPRLCNETGHCQQQQQQWVVSPTSCPPVVIPAWLKLFQMVFLSEMPPNFVSSAFSRVSVCFCFLSIILSFSAISVYRNYIPDYLSFLGPWVVRLSCSAVAIAGPTFKEIGGHPWFLLALYQMGRHFKLLKHWGLSDFPITDNFLFSIPLELEHTKTAIQSLDK
jgi:hypothetical protein